MIDWNIQARAHACEACGKHFADQQPYHTLLFDERQEFTRQDICEPCWQAQFSDGARDRKGFVSYWQGVYEAPPPPAPDPVQKETVESLLRKIMELNDPKFAAASYILAVMLERKRLLKIKEELKRDSQRIFVYEHPKSGDLFTIPDPGLQLDQLEQVQHDVSILLEHGLPPPPEDTAAADRQPGNGESMPHETSAAPAENNVPDGLPEPDPNAIPAAGPPPPA